MASPPTRSDVPPPRRDALDDTMPASGDGPPEAPRPPSLAETQVAEPASGAPEPPVRSTIPIDRYRIGRELGRGGMGRVVEAFDVQLGRTVAVKEVLANASGGTHRRFAREIHITARLEHPAIVPLYDSGINSEGKPYYVMRRVSGQPLDELIAKNRDLDDRLTLLPVVLSAIDAVAHAHKRGVIHRDLKPANILVGEDGEVVVIDWGLAKVVGEADEPIESRPPEPGDEPMANIPGTSEALKTQLGSVFGTPGFMSPEQARGEALDPQGDVYALGAVLYQLLAAAPPVAGHSATELMDKTRTHDIRPLAEAAPGAPRELVAIVEKALAFDAANRYADAAALAEDVRRFLAGQLVAAHAYTNAQKIVRVVRRHRGVFGVAALALVAVAVMSWIGVHRIVTERDAATVARREAVAGKREAEEARDRLAERHDALVVLQARALLDANPTEALALLKQLPAGSQRTDEARTIAQAATVRGAAWALQSTNELTTMAELDAGGRHLVQVSRDGMVRVFELDRRRLLTARPFAPYTRAVWLAGGKLLVTHHAAPAQLFDPVANALEPLPFEPISYARASAAGDRAIVTLASHAAAWFDPATRVLTPLAFPGPVEGVELARDGAFAVVYGKQLVRVYDPAGKQLAERTGDAVRVVTSRHRSFVVQTSTTTVVECRLDPKPTWTEVPLDVRAPHILVDTSYRGAHAAFYLSNGQLVEWNGTRVYRLADLERFSVPLLETRDDTLVAVATNNKVYWANELGRGQLAIPGSLSRIKLVARPDASRVVTVGDGIVMVFDLAPVIPARTRRFPSMAYALVSDDTLLDTGRKSGRWELVDLATGAVTPARAAGVLAPAVLELDGDRVLVRDMGPKGYRLEVLHVPTRASEQLAEGYRAWARLVPGDGVIFGAGDGIVMGKLGTAPAKQVAKIDGVVQAAAGVAPGVFVVHSSTGEIVRGELASGQLDRVRVPLGATGFVAADKRGRVMIAEDNRLLVWDGQVSEVARFERAIDRLEPIAGGMLVGLGRDHETHVVPLDPPPGPGNQPHRLFTSTSVSPSVSADGRLLATTGVGPGVVLVDLPSRVRWTLPALTFAREGVSLSPSGRSVLQDTATGLVVWRLPQVAADLGSWLEGQTNAVIDRDGVLAWPWHVAPAP